MSFPRRGGVLTRWRTTATGELSFLLWREEGSGFRLLASDPRTASGAGEFAARIPVSGGERLGLGMAKEVLDCRIFTKLGKDLIGVTGETAIGKAPPMLVEGGLRLNVAADIEPDADHDGYGDETQDVCPTDPSRQGPCADVDPPETTITKHPKKSSSSRQVKFRFSADEAGSTFECKLDKRPFKPCRSPFKRTVASRPPQLQGARDRRRRQPRSHRREIRLDCYRRVRLVLGAALCLAPARRPAAAQAAQRYAAPDATGVDCTQANRARSRTRSTAPRRTTR